MAEENNSATQEQTDGFELLQVFPIETAQNNAKEYNTTKYIQKFSNSIISRINDNINRHSEQGETDVQTVLSCLEICGDYPIQKDDPMLQSIINIVEQRYSAGGYDIHTNIIQSDWGIKGVVFTVAWNKEDEETGGDVNEI